MTAMLINTTRLLVSMEIISGCQVVKPKIYPKTQVLGLSKSF